MADAVTSLQHRADGDALGGGHVEIGDDPAGAVVAVAVQVNQDEAVVRPYHHPRRGRHDPLRRGPAPHERRRREVDGAPGRGDAPCAMGAAGEVPLLALRPWQEQRRLDGARRHGLRRDGARAEQALVGRRERGQPGVQLARRRPSGEVARHGQMRRAPARRPGRAPAVGELHVGLTPVEGAVVAVGQPGGHAGESVGGHRRRDAAPGRVDGAGLELDDRDEQPWADGVLDADARDGGGEVRVPAARGAAARQERRDVEVPVGRAADELGGLEHLAGRPGERTRRGRCLGGTGRREGVGGRRPGLAARIRPIGAHGARRRPRTRQRQDGDGGQAGDGGEGES